VGPGAGGGNRTHVASLEGWNSTIELHPRYAAYRSFFNHLESAIAPDFGPKFALSAPPLDQIWTKLRQNVAPAIASFEDVAPRSGDRKAVA
jgi:hypothetical protein